MTRQNTSSDPAISTRSCSRAVFASPPPPTDKNSQSSTFTSTGTLTPDSQHSEILKMADALSQLTQGCLRRITDGGEEDSPVVQCVQIKPMNNQTGAERYRVVMSDSINFMQGMLGQRKSIRLCGASHPTNWICRAKLPHPREQAQEGKHLPSRSVPIQLCEGQVHSCHSRS